ERTFLSDFDLIDKDFIRIELLKFDFSFAMDILIFTSKNAVLSVLQNKKIELLKQIKCICVGEKTKELLEKNGFTVLDFTHYAEDLTNITCEKYSDQTYASYWGNVR